MYLVGSTSPKVNVPFQVIDSGSKDTESRSRFMTPFAKRLSVTVGMLLVLSGDRLPTVRSVGPILYNKVLAQKKYMDEGSLLPEDTVNAIDAMRLGGNTYGLLRNHNTRGQCHCVDVLVA
jgi:hypothetical protein